MIGVSSLCLGLLAAVLFGGPSEKEQEVQRQIADEILRFHVLANSNAPEDQKEKLRVRDAVVRELNPLLQGASSKRETKELVKNELERVKETAEEIVYPKPVEVSLTSDWFPEKIYGDCTFPEGEYDALRIEIGEAAGRNWWCVLYPMLCFKEASRPVVSEEGEEMLEGVLDETAYDFILHPVKTKIRFRWLGK
ncbi:MAG: stage II sporulation protein R [Clostridiales bacterium]|nr:stage II sporulation protein R [Clostridiales bacterium]